MASYAESFNKANGSLGPDLSWNTPTGGFTGEVNTNTYMAPAALSSASALNYTTQQTDTNNQDLSMVIAVPTFSGTPTLWAHAENDLSKGVALEAAKSVGGRFTWSFNIGLTGANIVSSFVDEAPSSTPYTIRLIVFGNFAIGYRDGVQFASVTLPQIDGGTAAGVGVLFTGIGGGADGAIDSFTFQDYIVSSDIPFVVANDRYSVVVLAEQGTTTTTAEFRHFTAHPPYWGEELSSTSQIPSYYTADEQGSVVQGTLELPFAQAKADVELQVDSILVEFATRPTSLANDPATDLGFSGHVEGYGVPDYSRVTSGTLTTGIATSDDFSYTATNSTQASVFWPNTRVVKLPVRLDQKVRSCRVVFTAITMVEIKRVHLLGKQVPSRVT